MVRISPQNTQLYFLKLLAVKIIPQGNRIIENKEIKYHYSAYRKKTNFLLESLETWHLIGWHQGKSLLLKVYFKHSISKPTDIRHFLSFFKLQIVLLAWVIICVRLVGWILQRNWYRVRVFDLALSNLPTRPVGRESLPTSRPTNVRLTRGDTSRRRAEPPLQLRHRHNWVRADFGESLSAPAREWNKTCGKK